MTAATAQLCGHRWAGPCDRHPAAPVVRGPMRHRCGEPADHTTPLRSHHREEHHPMSDQICPNCAPGYDCERGIYTPDDLVATAVAIGPDGTAYLDDDTEVPASEWEEVNSDA